MNTLSDFQTRSLIEAALREDIRSGDITTTALIPASATARAILRTREKGVLCGGEIAQSVFETLDKNVMFSQSRSDGEKMMDGDVICAL
jgi:nicotinate-nucleotide pyrophosphorylase (carboxylating)